MAWEIINDPPIIDHKLIADSIKIGKKVIIQFSNPRYNKALLKDLDSLCAVSDANLAIRFYGHYQSGFDCKALKYIPQVKSLSIDCLQKAINIPELSNLSNLESLAIDIFELQEDDIIGSNNFKTIKELRIGDTKTRKLDLIHLKEYTKLEKLSVTGQTRNIDVIGDLCILDSLRLNSISKVRVDFINRLNRLKLLTFLLGGRNNIDEIERNHIEHLEIIRVRGFNSFNNLDNFEKLKFLQIEDQIQLKNLYFSKQLKDLQNLRILNCKNLSSITGLENTGKLNSLIIYKTMIEFNAFIVNALPKSLQHLGFYTDKETVNKEIKKRLESLGYNKAAFLPQTGASL
ncbi:hypothetical protein GCM10011375_25000 [Hymenobacter qilianensis]|uniref:Uncharacterized protein n=2 Tax=Hymenobacter qilianensis TaxID=1385715 RepID=A0ACB5PT26_9BACT|nr:hypothetical protein [Hymenobacter qilianensis]QNP52581.1 hypothetical protein H9L05_02100 [Hymenobacter qilianensis]GGF68938.1 hypothetical protein GCM10011375_25000 [Hymenobacter qilianensis]